MTINLDTLRTTVENAGEAWADGEHIDIITPPAVLALLSRLEQAEQAVQRVREVIRQYDPDCLTCMCNSDGDCCKCTVFDFQEALDGDGRG